MVQSFNGLVQESVIEEDLEDLITAATAVLHMIAMLISFLPYFHK
jgi:hypothetical protein